MFNFDGSFFISPFLACNPVEGRWTWDSVIPVTWLVWWSLFFRLAKPPVPLGSYSSSSSCSVESPFFWRNLLCLSSCRIWGENWGENEGSSFNGDDSLSNLESRLITERSLPRGSTNSFSILSSKLSYWSILTSNFGLLAGSSSHRSLFL